jgi:hypothetical protein
MFQRVSVEGAKEVFDIMLKEVGKCIGVALG